MIIRENYAYEMLMKGKRHDAREMLDYRDIRIETGVIAKAEGSAHVRIGDTQVIVGVKMGVGTPFPDTPGEGILMVGAEFNPIASPDFEAGPPSEDAVEFARVVDRGLRESKCIALDELAINEEKVWTVFVDIDVINNAGNLLDAAALGAIAALRTAKIPKIDENLKIQAGEREKPLPVRFTPINITVCKCGDSMMLDPTYLEEEVLDSKLAVSTREDGSVCALQKQGRKGIKFDELEKMIDIALEKGKELRKLVEGA
jgi:exosome complex component RRP42